MLGKTLGKAGTKGIASLMGAMLGIPGLGLLSSFAPYDADAKAHNLAQMAAGKPHHDPETGRWGMAPTGTGFMSNMKDHMTAMNPESWHAGPVQDTVSGGPAGAYEGGQATGGPQQGQAVRAGRKEAR